jgi:RNA polymerase sigma factor (sigma-70 family)
MAEILFIRIIPRPALLPRSMNSITTQLYPALLRHAAVMLSGSAAAQAMQPADLLHMAVEKLCRRPPAQIEEHPQRFTGLMCMIMQRTLIDEQRKARAARRPDFITAGTLDEANEVAVDSGGHEIVLWVQEALNGLESQNAPAAALLRLHYIEGRTGVEIAARFGLSTGCISRRLSSALDALRDVVAATGGFTCQPAARGV